MRIYTRKQLREKLGGISETTLWRLEKTGLVPKSFNITARMKAFDADLVDSMLSERAANAANSEF